MQGRFKKSATLNQYFFIILPDGFKTVFKIQQNGLFTNLIGAFDLTNEVSNKGSALSTNLETKEILESKTSNTLNKKVILGNCPRMTLDIMSMAIEVLLNQLLFLKP